MFCLLCDFFGEIVFICGCVGVVGVVFCEFIVVVVMGLEYVVFVVL